MDEWPFVLLHSRMVEEPFREQVMRRLEETGMKVAELARQAGVSKGAIYKLLQRPGASTSAENARAIADALGLGVPRVAIDASTTGTTGTIGPSEDLEDEALALVPVYDVDASAGTGLIAPEHEAVAYRLELPMSYLASLTDSHPRHLQVIGVKGISMLPTLKPGDLVMIDRAKTSLSYDGLFVVDIDDAILVKRIGRSSHPGHVMVISDNKDQPSFERAIKDIRVLGKVICAVVKQ